MKSINNTYSPETSLYVEALREICQAEDKILSGLTSTYGDEKGEEMWYKSQVYSLIESTKKEVKLLIGDSLELDFSGLGNTDNTKVGEGEVC